MSSARLEKVQPLYPNTETTMNFFGVLSAPVTVDWEITMRGNLRCLHCCFAAGAPRSNELTTEEAKKLIGASSRFVKLRNETQGGMTEAARSLGEGRHEPFDGPAYRRAEGRGGAGETAFLVDVIAASKRPHLLRRISVSSGGCRPPALKRGVEAPPLVGRSAQESGGVEGSGGGVSWGGGAGPYLGLHHRSAQATGGEELLVVEQVRLR